MGKTWFDMQHELNESYAKQIGGLINVIKKLTSIVEDHEKDMIEMAVRINKLESELSRR